MSETEEFDLTVIRRALTGTRFARRLHGVFVVAQAGEHDDGQLRVLLPDHGNEGQPVDFGHADIEQYDIRGELPDFGKH